MYNGAEPSVHRREVSSIQRLYCVPDSLYEEWRYPVLTSEVWPKLASISCPRESNLLKQPPVNSTWVTKNLY